MRCWVITLLLLSTNVVFHCALKIFFYNFSIEITFFYAIFILYFWFSFSCHRFLFSSMNISSAYFILHFFNLRPISSPAVRRGKLSLDSPFTSPFFDVPSAVNLSDHQSFFVRISLIFRNFIVILNRPLRHIFCTCHKEQQIIFTKIIYEKSKKKNLVGHQYNGFTVVIFLFLYVRGFAKKFILILFHRYLSTILLSLLFSFLFLSLFIILFLWFSFIAVSSFFLYDVSLTNFLLSFTFFSCTFFVALSFFPIFVVERFFLIPF